MAIDRQLAEDRGSERWRVVVVDDDPDMRVLLRTILVADGRFDVVGEATDGREGVAAVEALRPDVVVLDLSMPRMDGVAALPLIKQAVPRCRVAICSAHRESTAYLSALGADIYLDKLDAPKQLTAALLDLCSAG